MSRRARYSTLKVSATDAIRRWDKPSKLGKNVLNNLQLEEIKPNFYLISGILLDNRKITNIYSFYAKSDNVNSAASQTALEKSVVVCKEFLYIGDPITVRTKCIGFLEHGYCCKFWVAITSRLNISAVASPQRQTALLYYLLLYFITQLYTQVGNVFIYIAIFTLEIGWRLGSPWRAILKFWLNKGF